MVNQTQVLLDWYDQNRRILPWREDPTPYHVWLSEIMLQQTRVEAGIGYYQRFLKELPDIRSLAAAPEDQYMKLWEGLGYYSRVRNLHKAAVIIMSDYGGKMPDRAEELVKLPGIGPYTAAAIASIAFGQRIVSVDGNLLRVFARLTEYPDDIRSQQAKKKAEQYFSGMQPVNRPGDFNQALMDLGAVICLPNGVPHCGECPCRQSCTASDDERQQDFPVMAPKKERRVENRTVFVIYAGDRILIRRRPHRGLLADLYEFPNTEGLLNKTEAGRYIASLTGADDKTIDGMRNLGKAKHIFTHIEWHMTGYEIHLRSDCVRKLFCKDDTGEAGNYLERSIASGDLIAASLEDLTERYSIPSAFEQYRRQIMLPEVG